MESSWATQLADYQRADHGVRAREQDEPAHEAETIMMPFHLMMLLETIVAQQVEQTMLLHEILATLRARAD